MRWTHNSEAVGRLAAALAHGDIQPRAVRDLVHYYVRSRRLPKARAVRRKRKVTAPWRGPQPYVPRIMFFEEDDVPMVPPPPAPRILPELVARVLESDYDRIWNRMRHECALQAELIALQNRIVKAHAELEAIETLLAASEAAERMLR